MAKRQETGGLAALKADLKAQQFRRLYLFYGEERYLLEHYLALLQKKLLDGPAQDFNYHRFPQGSAELQTLTDAVESVPMMAEHTLVQVDDLDLSKLSESFRDGLTALLSDIPDYCTVVFVFDTVPYKVDGRQKKFKAALEQGLAVEFARQSQRDLTAWIRKHALAAGKDISDKACEYLTFRTGGAMTTLASELDKLTAYAAGHEITMQDIDAVVIPVLDAQVFDMTDAIAAGNFAKALEVLHLLLSMQQEPIPILAAIGSQMRRLYYARVCLNAGKGDGALGELIKTATGRAPHPYVLSKTVSAARRLSDGFCRRAMKLCMEADWQMKSSGDDPARILELLLLTLREEARRG